MANKDYSKIIPMIKEMQHDSESSFDVDKLVRVGLKLSEQLDHVNDMLVTRVVNKFNELLAILANKKEDFVLYEKVAYGVVLLDTYIEKKEGFRLYDIDTTVESYINSVDEYVKNGVKVKLNVCLNSKESILSAIKVDLDKVFKFHQDKNAKDAIPIINNTIAASYYVDRKLESKLTELLNVVKNGQDSVLLQEIFASLSAVSIYKDVNVDIYNDNPIVLPSIKIVAVVENTTIIPLKLDISPIIILEENILSSNNVSSITEDLDVEMLEIYQSEADEVSDNILKSVNFLRIDPNNKDELVNVKRAFHTLKGSGRMVKLNNVGEVGFCSEMLMNGWIQAGKGATEKLLNYCEWLAKHFKDWSVSIETMVNADNKVNLSIVKSHIDMIEDKVVEDIEIIPTAIVVEPISTDIENPNPIVIVQPTTFGVVDLSEEELEAQNKIELDKIFLKEITALLDKLNFETESFLSDMSHIVKYDHMRVVHTIGSICKAMNADNSHDNIVEISVKFEKWLDLNMDKQIPLTDNIFYIVREYVISVEDAVKGLGASAKPNFYKPLLVALESAVSEFLTTESAGTTKNTVTIDKGEFVDNTQPIVIQIAQKLVISNKVPKAFLDATVDVDDDIDPDLMAIFADEAQGLVNEIQNTLSVMKNSDNLLRNAQDLKRHLHTIKGGARMAGAMKIGSIFHTMETEIDDALHNGVLNTDLVNKFAGEVSYVTEAIDLLVSGEYFDLPKETNSDMQVSPVMQEKSRGLTASELVENAISSSSETAVFRAQLRKMLDSSADYFSELSKSIIKFRKLMREVELQAELQMKTGQTTNKAADVVDASGMVINNFSEVEDKNTDAVSVQSSGEEDITGRESESFDALQFDRFTRLQEITKQVAETVGDIEDIQDTLGLAINNSIVLIDKHNSVSTDIHSMVSQMRLTPLSSLTARFRKIIQQACKDTGKKAALKITGEAKIDRAVLDKITIAIEHILRNGIAHGVEMPDVRTNAGKNEEGIIEIHATTSGQDALITISDDGGGIDINAIISKAKKLGLLDQAGNDPINLIFAPGFSTATTLTETSGRGVGMDIVKKEITDLGGVITITTEQGKGSKFLIKVPSIMSAIAAIPVKAGENWYAIPASIIEKVVHSMDMKVIDEAGVAYVEHDTRKYKVLELIGKTTMEDLKVNKKGGLYIVMKDSNVAVYCSEIDRGQEFVTKDFGKQSLSIPGIIGGAITESGAATLLIDPVAIARTESVYISANGAGTEIVPARDDKTVVMVVDDSLTVRKASERFLTREGFKVNTAIDGMDALEKLQSVGIPDIILLDIEMPRMDGFEFLKSIRATDKYKDIPVIMISSRNIDTHKETAIKLGVNAYLGKPYQEQVLLGEIRKHTLRQEA